MANVRHQSKGLIQSTVLQYFVDADLGSKILNVIMVISFSPTVIEAVVNVHNVISKTKPGKQIM